MLSIHHVSLSVSDLTTSIAFYSRLGFAEVLRWRSDDGSLTIVHLKLRAFILELFNYSRPVPHPPDRSLDDDLRVIGVRHFALRTASLAGTVTALKANGLSLYRDITEGRTGISYCFFRDPDGIFVEIVEDHRPFMPALEEEA
jgi:glyoxylase I family protein